MAGLVPAIHVDPRACPTAVRFSFSCSVLAPFAPSSPPKFPVAGLDPATHVFPPPRCRRKKTWVAGSSPSTGCLWLFVNKILQQDSLNRTAVGQARARGFAG